MTKEDILEVMEDETQPFAPDEIILDDRLSVRPSAAFKADKEETARVKELAQTIKEESQIQPGVVLQAEEDGKFYLLIGSRRLRAIKYINETGGDLDGNEMPFKATVIKGKLADATKLKRKAVIENIHRKNYNPMEFALLIRQTEQENQFTKQSETAKYFGVSSAQISTHLDLFTLPDELQKDVLAGKYSAQAAFDLVKVHPGKRKEVAQRAEQKAEEENQRRQAGKNGGKKKEGGGGKEGDEEEESGRYKRRHVVEAIRETPDATEKPISRTRKELVAFFDSQDGPANGYANGPLREFCQFFRDKYATGVATDRQMDNKWNRIADIVMKEDPGTRSKRDQVDEEGEEEAPASKSNAAPKSTGNGTGTGKKRGRPRKS